MTINQLHSAKVPGLDVFSTKWYKEMQYRIHPKFRLKAEYSPNIFVTLASQSSNFAAAVSLEYAKHTPISVANIGGRSQLSVLVLRLMKVLPEMGFVTNMAMFKFNYSLT